MDAAHGIAGLATQTNAVKFYYSKRKESLSRELRRSAMTRQLLCSAAPPPPPCSLDELEVGAFYEIDHQMLPPKSPSHLKAVRVVKVSEATKLNVTVSFPSTYSLRNYFSSITAKPAGGQIPELDERFVMSTHNSGKILRRLIPASQMNEEKHLQSFWLAAPFALPGAAATKVAVAGEEEEESPKPRQLALKWGTRRKVKYINQQQQELLPPSATREEEDDSETMEAVQNIICTRKRARDACEKNKKTKKMEKAPVERKEKKIKKKPRYEKREKNKREQSESARVKDSKERWSAERYKSAELKLLDIMREKGAVLGNPILRQELRDEARKHIGDTGLLDHLLKHMAGKAVNDRSERFRRQHNAEGAMEYWLEPAELDEVRKKAGVMDPYWFPPQGWKPGDATSSCLCGNECLKQISELREEIGILKRDMEELQALKQLQKEARDHDQQSEAAGSSILQEKYEILLGKNTKLEEELAGLFSTLKTVKEEMVQLKKEEEKIKKVAEVETKDAGKMNENKKKGAAAVRRSGFRICKPQGTFIWPNNGAISCNNENSSGPADLFNIISNTTTSNVTGTSASTTGIESGGGVAVVPTNNTMGGHHAYHQYQQLAMMFGAGSAGFGGGPPSCSSATSAPKLLLLPSPTTPRSSTSSVTPPPAAAAVQELPRAHSDVAVVPPLIAPQDKMGISYNTTHAPSPSMYCSLMATAAARASVGDDVKKREDALHNITTDLVLGTPSPSSDYL